jgi:hypothetical protein
MTLTLTYDNAKLHDGIGSQLQRIYGLYAVARAQGLMYQHAPIAGLSQYDYSSLRFRQCSAEELDAANAQFAIRADPIQAWDEIVEATDITNEELLALTVQARKKRILAKILLPYPILERAPALYSHVKEVSPYSARREQRLRVAIHIRRGELPFIAPSRIVPNGYFVSVMQTIGRTLAALGVDYSATVFTETVPWDCDSVDGSMFKDVQVTVRANGDAVSVLRHLAEADILVLSHSSYSYIAALLNRSAVVVYNRFWHAPLPEWIVAHSNGHFDIAQFATAIKCHLETRSLLHPEQCRGDAAH